MRGRVRYTEWMERLAKDTVDLWGGEVSTVDTGLIEFGGGQMDVGGTLRSLVEGGRGE